MRVIDCSVWLGDWPFAPMSPPWSRLAAHLAGAKTTDAVVSPLTAVCPPTPDAANKQAADLVRHNGVPRLWLAPILNPTARNCHHLIERYAANPAVAAVRLTPTYHRYRLPDAGLAPFWTAAERAGLPVMVQARIEDARMQSPLLRVPPFDATDLSAVSAMYPAVTLIACGVTVGEAMALPADRANVYVETSWLDGPDPLHELDEAGQRRLVHGSHAPLFEPLAALGKLECSRLPDHQKAMIASGYAQQALRLKGATE